MRMVRGSERASMQFLTMQRPSTRETWGPKLEFKTYDGMEMQK